MSPIALVVDTSGVERAFHNIETSEEAVAMFKLEGKAIAAYRLALEAPRRTGRLIGSIVSRDVESGFEVFVKAPYALFVERGTGMFSRTPHLIYPKKAKALRFEIGGKVIFAKYIIGQPGQFFMKRTREAIGPELRDLAARLWREHHVV